MIAPKFVRFRGDTINVTKIVDVCYNSAAQETAICYEVGDKGLWAYYDGDCRDEIWELIKLAMQPKDESYPSDTTHLEQRIKDTEEKVTLIVDHIEADHVSRIKAAGCLASFAGL